MDERAEARCEVSFLIFLLKLSIHPCHRERVRELWHHGYDHYMDSGTYVSSASWEGSHHVGLVSISLG